MRNFVDERDVSIIDAVAGVDLKIEIRGPDGGVPQPLQFLLLDFFRVGVGQLSGMQLDDVGAECHRRIDLFPSRIDEHADANARGMKPLHRPV